MADTESGELKIASKEDAPVAGEEAETEVVEPVEEEEVDCLMGEEEDECDTDDGEGS